MNLVIITYGGDLGTDYVGPFRRDSDRARTLAVEINTKFGADGVEATVVPLRSSKRITEDIADGVFARLTPAMF